MAQHTQPVAQQPQHTTTSATVTTQQSTNSNNNNNNNNNNNTNASSNTTTPTAQSNNNNNTQTQTLAIHQQQNNNGIAPGQSYNTTATVAAATVQQQHQQPIYNQPLHTSNAVYMAAPGVHQGGSMYPTAAMISTHIPSNVYVNNVTANVNLHGWAHSVPAYIPAGGTPHYIHGELPPDQTTQVMQAMPVALAPSNATVGMNSSASAGGGGGGRGSRRGRGRGSGGSRRGEYTNQRHSTSEGSPAPQQMSQSQEQLQQQQQQQLDNQLMSAGGPPPPTAYAPHPHYAHTAPPYSYAPYPAYFAPQNQIIHPAQTAAAQQATGTPFYVSPMPIYNTQPALYNYMGGYFYPPMMNPAEYQYVHGAPDDGQGGDERSHSDAMMPQIWHPQQMYADEYAMNAADMHAAAGSDDLNHNNSSLGSSDTPSMLSPTYPIYEMQQQMGVMQIYDDSQMGQMQMMQQGGTANMQQLEDDLSECGGQTGAPIQMLPAGAILTTGPMQMSNEPPQLVQHHGLTQVVQQAPPPPASLHLMQSQSIIAIEPQAQAPLTQQQQCAADSAEHIVTVAGNFVNNNNNQFNETNVSSSFNLQSADSLNSLNEFNLQSNENIAQDYQQQQQQHQQQQQNVVETAASTIIAAAASTTGSTTTLSANEINENVPNHELVAQTLQQQQLYHQQQQQENVTPMQQQLSMQQQQPLHQQLQQQPMAKQQSVQQQHHNHQQQSQYQQHHPQQQQQQKPSAHHSQQQQQPQQHHHQHQQTNTSPQQQQQQQSSHHQHHHQQHDQRKQSQAYSNQQPRRKYNSDYSNSNSNIINSNAHHHQQQQQSHVPNNNNDSSIQTTKTMSWTNSSQHKKSTASVAVTATPTNNNTGGSGNSNNRQTGVYSGRTYTNQQHQNHHYQQQQQQQQQQPQQQNYLPQPQMRNYGAMKMPSSPISSSATPPSMTVERKNSIQQQQQQQPQHAVVEQPTKSTGGVGNSGYTNSSNTITTNIGSVAMANTTTASTTVVPQQFAQQQHQNNSTPETSNVVAAAPAAVAAQMQMKNVVSATTTPTINLAPPVTTATTSTPSGTSWASLFSNKNISSATISGNSSTNATSSGGNIQLPNVSNISVSSPALPPPFSSKKPIAKVAPYEGITPVTPAPPLITPGAMSYSAASAQGIPPTPAATVKSSKPSEAATVAVAAIRASANLDEWTRKYADFFNNAKTELAPVSLRPRGLTNRSNYCYINSILQALLGCSPLYNLMRSIPKHAAALSEVKTPTVNAMMNFMHNFSTLPSGLRLRMNNKGPKGKDDIGGDLQCDLAFEPTEIYKLWNDSREEHVEGRQEDAEEFLGYVLNKLNDEMLEVIKLIAKPNTEQNGQNDLSENDDGGDVWQMICNNRNKGSITRQTDFGRTPLSDIFRGELRSRLQREGEHSTDVIQPFFTLQLNIEKAASVKEALEILVGRDQLEGVTGSKSKQEVVAWQQMTLEKLPIVLILHLKWFDYRSDGCTKILKKVEFPVELKIDTKILASKKYSQKQRAYRLFAVVYHDGKEATKGHYITDVFHAGYNSWLRYDDSSVKPVSENHVLLPRTPRVPYLLYYRRCDTIPQQSMSSTTNATSSTSSSTSSSSVGGGGSGSGGGFSGGVSK